MKIPLRYQVTEYDCATTSLYNAISILIERDKIPAKILKIINKYTLDCADKFGNPGQGGTSRKSITKIAKKINKYKNSFKITCKKLNGEKVTIEKIKKCLEEKGCILIRVYLEVEHYVIITKIKKNKIYIFDPYYINPRKYKDKEVKIVLNKPSKYNRIVSLKRLLSETKKNFAMGKKEKRECLLMNKSS